MKSTFQFKNLVPYLIGLLVFLIVTFIYFSPVLSGKTLSMHDNNQATGMAQEIVDYHTKTGEWAWWTNSTFGGMPGFLIAGGYPYNVAGHIGAFLGQLLPTPVNVIFLMMAGFFILMITLKKNIWVAVLASIAYALGTYNLLYTEAGHISKIIALAYAPALFAGFILIFRGKYLVGAFVTAFFLAMELYANHLQITYYFFIILLVYSLYEGIKLILNGEIKNFRDFFEKKKILQLENVVPELLNVEENFENDIKIFKKNFNKFNKIINENFEKISKEKKENLTKEIEILIKKIERMLKELD